MAPQCSQNKIHTKYLIPFMILPQMTHTRSLFIIQFPKSTSPFFPSQSIHTKLIIIPQTWNIYFHCYNFQSPKSYFFGGAHRIFINALIPIHILGYKLAVTFFRKLTLTYSSTPPLPTTSLEILIALDFLYRSPYFAVL